MVTLQQQRAGINQGHIVEFLELDITSYGGPLYRIYNSLDAQQPTLTFLGVTWIPMPYEAKGFAQDGAGGTPNPSIEIADFDGILMQQALDYNDLHGCPVARYETTWEVLNSGGSGEELHYGDYWFVDQKVAANGVTYKIALAASHNQKRTQLPSWTMDKDQFPGLNHGRYR